MRSAPVLVVLAFSASVAHAQPPSPIRTSMDRLADTAAQQASQEARARQPAARRSALFWSGLTVGVAGATTSVLGLTVFRTDRTSTGNAPDETYRACVALRDSNPIYATSQCGALKGKNLKLLWGGVALGGAGAALMITGRHTSAALAPGAVGVFHRWQF